MEMGESGVGVSKKVMDWVDWEVPMRWSIKVLETILSKLNHLRYS